MPVHSTYLGLSVETLTIATLSHGSIHLTGLLAYSLSAGLDSLGDAAIPVEPLGNLQAECRKPPQGSAY